MCSVSRLAGALSLAGIVFLCASSLPAADRTAPEPKLVEEIVAKVNGDIITRGELDKQRAAIRAELEKQGMSGAALDAEVKKRAADALRDQIDQLLLVQKGKELNINVDSEVNRRVAQVQKQSGIADVDKFHDWVREQTGESFEDLKLQFKNQILTQRVIGEEVWRQVSIPRAEAEKYYNDHKSEFVREEMVSLREIQVSSGDNSPAKVAAAEKKAKDLVDRARKGEKFPDLARQYSDALTASDDGILGTFKKGDLAKPIEDIVFAQDKGYVSDPIRIGPGFEIVRVEEHFKAGQASFDEVQNDIIGKLSEPKVQPKLREYLTTLRENAYMQIKEPYLDSGAAQGKDTAWKDALKLVPDQVTKEQVANRRHFKKFLKVIPYGRTGEKDTAPAAPATATPVQQTPVKNADSSPQK